MSLSFTPSNNKLVAAFQSCSLNSNQFYSKEKVIEALDRLVHKLA